METCNPQSPLEFWPIGNTQKCPIQLPGNKCKWVEQVLLHPFSTLAGWNIHVLVGAEAPLGTMRQQFRLSGKQILESQYQP